MNLASSAPQFAVHSAHQVHHVCGHKVSYESQTQRPARSMQAVCSLLKQTSSDGIKASRDSSGRLSKSRILQAGRSCDTTSVVSDVNSVNEAKSKLRTHG